MGLDITGYKDLQFIRKRIDDEEPEEWANKGNWILVDLDCKRWAAQTSDLQPGFYAGERIVSFRAGSYGGYNDWRAWLCEMVLGVKPQVVWDNSAQYQDKPFYLLIAFSDCEGVIGPGACRKLRDDFHEEFKKQQAAGTKFVGSFWNLFLEWKQALQAVGDHGCLDFH